MNLRACWSCHWLVIALVVDVTRSMVSFASCDGRSFFTNEDFIHHHGGRFVFWQLRLAICVRALRSSQLENVWYGVGRPLTLEQIRGRLFELDVVRSRGLSAGSLPFYAAATS